MKSINKRKYHIRSFDVFIWRIFFLIFSLLNWNLATNEHFNFRSFRKFYTDDEDDGTQEQNKDSVQFFFYCDITNSQSVSEHMFKQKIFCPQMSCWDKTWPGRPTEVCCCMSNICVILVNVFGSNICLRRGLFISWFPSMLSTTGWTCFHFKNWFQHPHLELRKEIVTRSSFTEVVQCAALGQEKGSAGQEGKVAGVHDQAGVQVQAL